MNLYLEYILGHSDRPSMKGRKGMDFIFHWSETSEFSYILQSLKNVDVSPFLSQNFDT